MSAPVQAAAPARPVADETAATPPQTRPGRPGGVQKHLAEHVAAALPAHAAAKPIEVWFQDEARVGQQGTLTHVWAERGSRPLGVRDDRHDSAWLFVAVCPARSVGAALVMPWVSAEAMSLHLAEIGKVVSAGAHALVICDGAGWHQLGGRLELPDNLSLLHLPGYALQLNPIENVWEHLRARSCPRRWCRSCG